MDSVFHNAYAFPYFYDAVGGEIGDALNQSAGPVNLDIGVGGVAKTKMKAEVALRDVSAATAHFLHLLVGLRGFAAMVFGIAGAEDYAGADSIAI
jgi:hypothetical protein